MEPVARAMLASKVRTFCRKVNVRSAMAPFAARRATTSTDPPEREHAMKALILQQLGGPEQLRIDEIVTPEPGPAGSRAPARRGAQSSRCLDYPWPVSRHPPAVHPRFRMGPARSTRSAPTLRRTCSIGR